MTNPEVSELLETAKWAWEMADRLPPSRARGDLIRLGSKCRALHRGQVKRSESKS